MKNLLIFAAISLFVAGCGTTEMEKRLEDNFVYNCSLQLLDKRVSAADAEKICTASHKAEIDEKTHQTGAPTPTPTPTPAELVKPEPTPAK